MKIANKQFNSLNNQYELTLSKFSIVQQCFDENIPIPEVTYNFTPFDKISQVESNGVIGKFKLKWCLLTAKTLIFGQNDIFSKSNKVFAVCKKTVFYQFWNF